MNELGAKQRLFTQLIAQWIDWVYREGFSLTMGESFRTPEQAAINARKGTGIKNSLHTQRLALDVNLFKKDALGNWVWLSQGDEPEWLYVGQHWEQMGGTWGGRFRDSNHLSLEFNGVK